MDARPPYEEESHRTAREIVDAVTHLQPNACDLIHEVARKDKDLLAMVDLNSGQKITFGQLSTTIAKVASRLQLLGLKPKDRVAVFVADGPRFVVVVNALFHLGAVPVLIDPGMGVDNVATCIAEQKPRGLVGIHKAQVLKLVKREAFKSVKVNVVLDGWFFGARTLSTSPGDDGARDGGRDAYVAMHRQAGAEPAAVLYTSGSTGAPKGVLYTHGMIMAQATSIRDMFAIARGDVEVCCFLPFALFSVAMGTTAVFPAMDFRFPAKADPQKILAALQSGGGKPATSAFASPALWEPFSRFLVDSKTTLPGLKRLLTAGAPARPTLHERLLTALPDGDVFTPYGATEALPVAFMNGRGVVSETATLTRAGKGTCVGGLAPHIQVKIIALHDEPIATLADARELPDGEIGEIIVSGPCVTRAYDEVSERATDANRKSKIKDGEVVWHRMGDAGYFDAQRRLWFCGRKSQRVVKADGTVLFTDPVEGQVEALLGGTTGGGARVALAGVGDKGEQRAVVCVEHVSGPPPALDLAAVQAVVPAIDEVRVHAGPFPVDRRHNAKIEREKLAALVRR